MSGLAATLRIARRDARRAKGRSALVVGMIALPILGVGMADVVYRTFQLTPAQAAVRDFGRADATVMDSNLLTLVQQDSAGMYAGDGATRVGPPPPIASALPAGTRVLTSFGTVSSLTHDHLTVLPNQLTDFAYTDPMTQGMFTSAAGRPPVRSGEIALTRDLARALSAKVGDTVSVNRSSAVVTGLVDSASTVRAKAAFVAPGTLPKGSYLDRVLVDTPHPMTWADVLAANAKGYVVHARSRVPGSPPPFQQAVLRRLGGTTLTFAGLIAGLVLLEIVLLAGPAFAVGVKRRSHDLALVAASGGERHHLRSIVLGGGVVLGAVGGAFGAVIGVVAARLMLPVFTGLRGTRPGPFEVRPLELVAIVGIGVLTALLASMLPALTAARTDVLAALTGRRGTVRNRRRLPVLGAAGTVVGAVIAFYGATRLSTNLVLVGSIIAELGLVATTPFLVGQVAKLGRFLPVGPRFALRDAARNRSRTAPAVSAILAAVAGAIAVSTFVGSLDRHDRDQYSLRGPLGAATVDLTFGSSALAPQVVTALKKTLPGTTVVTVQGALRDGKPGTTSPDVQVADNVARECPDLHASPSVLAQLAKDPRCQRGLGYTSLQGLLVGDADTVRNVTGESGQKYADVLARGGAVVPWASVQDDGTAILGVIDSNTGAALSKRIRVPAVALPVHGVGAVVVSPDVARRLGQTPRTIGVIALGRHAPSAHDQARAQNELTSLDSNAYLTVERGYESSYGIGLLALLLGSSVIVLGASGVATGLAAADGKADLGTLAAVGASPTTRRSLAAFQSAVTAVLGTVLGVVAGLVPGIAIVRAINAAAHATPLYGDRYPMVLPWTNVLTTLFVVPAVAALAAALLTRSRLPVVRRMA